MKHIFPIALIALMSTAALAGCLSGSGDLDAGGEQATADGFPWNGPAVPPGTYTFESSSAVPATQGTLDVLPLAKHFLSSEVDGVDIEVGLWLPDVEPGTKVPVLVDAGPYYGNNGPPMESESGHLGRLIRNFVPHGYAVAGVAVRGTGGSGGCMDLMGPNEVADLSQAVTWLGTQDWSNGNVGMGGLSYDGSTPWMVASTGNPHLKTIFPASGVPDVYELMFRNGTSEIRGPFLLNALYYSFVVREGAPPPATPEEAQRAAVHTVEGAACPDHLVGMEAALYSGATGARDPTGYWAERRLKDGVEANYKGSILLVQGLQDWNVDPALNIPWADELNRTGIPVYQWLGQWGHSHGDAGSSDSGTKRYDWAEVQLRWFDYWLKEQTHLELGPPVQVLSDEGRWRMDHSFPPRDANWTSYHLSSGQTLADEAGSAGSVLLAPQAYSASPVPPLDAAPGRSADFFTEAMQRDTHISGLPKVHVTVTPHGSTGSIAAWLYDVSPDGEADPIGWTMMNLQFADGGYEPSTLMPGEPVVAKMEIQPMDAVVEEGHRLMLRVWNFRDEVPGNEVQGRLPALAPAPFTLEFGGSAQSVLELPTVQRPESWFFEPPSG